MKISTKNALNGRLLTAPLVIGCLVFYAIPFLLVVRYSATNGVGSSRQFVGLAHYESLIDNAIFRMAFGNTMRFLLVALPLIDAGHPLAHLHPAVGDESLVQQAVEDRGQRSLLGGQQAAAGTLCFQHWLLAVHILPFQQ